MSQSIYRETIKRAWHITWHNKPLWILGLLSLLIGQFGLADFIGQVLKANQWPTMRYAMDGWQITNLKMSVGIIWAGGIFLGLMLLAAVAAAIAEGALIYAAAHAYKKNSLAAAKISWEKGAAAVWPIIGISLVRRIALGLIACLVAYTIQKIYLTTGYFNWVYLVATVVLVFTAVVVSAVSIFALCYSVIGAHDLGASIRRGWQLFTEHVLVAIELTALLFCLNFVLLFVLLIVTFVIFIPSIFFWLTATVTGQAVWFTVGFLVGWILLAFSVGIIGAAYNTFTVNAWVSLFMKMHHEGIGSRLLHHAKKIFNR
ncbi:MAG: hypothetical protein Q7S66_04430 [bacterium]|nr:hypothetical protein [bacterium]